FVLPAKSGTSYVHIRSSAYANLPAPGTRVGPSDASSMAKIVTPNLDGAIKTAAGANHYRLIGIELGIASGVASNNGIVMLGDGAQTTQASVPNNIIIDRCYIHGNNTGESRRAIALNSAS